MELNKKQQELLEFVKLKHKDQVRKSITGYYTLDTGYSLLDSRYYILVLNNRHYTLSYYHFLLDTSHLWENSHSLFRIKKGICSKIWRNKHKGEFALKFGW